MLKQADMQVDPTGLEQLKKDYENLNTMPMQGSGYTFVPKAGACPHCGYCPHCGRGGHQTYPFYQPLITYTGINTPNITPTITGSAEGWGGVKSASIH